MSEQHGSLQSALVNDLGASLRALGHHEGDDWTVEYLREDLQETLDAEAIDDIAGDLALSVVGGTRQEDLYDLGSVRATVRVFDDGVVVHVPVDDRGGYLVSVDHTEGLVGRDVAATVREHATGTKR